MRKSSRERPGKGQILSDMAAIHCIWKLGCEERGERSRELVRRVVESSEVALRRSSSFRFSSCTFSRFCLCLEFIARRTIEVEGDGGKLWLMVVEERVCGAEVRAVYLSRDRVEVSQSAGARKITGKG